MKTYIGTKIVKAESMDELTFLEEHRNMSREDKTFIPGYYITDNDGYEAWSPKEVFESHYREITETEKNTVME